MHQLRPTVETVLARKRVLRRGQLRRRIACAQRVEMFPGLLAELLKRRTLRETTRGDGHDDLLSDIARVRSTGRKKIADCDGDYVRWAQPFPRTGCVLSREPSIRNSTVQGKWTGPVAGSRRVFFPHADTARCDCYLFGVDLRWSDDTADDVLGTADASVTPFAAGADASARLAKSQWSGHVHLPAECRTPHVYGQARRHDGHRTITHRLDPRRLRLVGGRHPDGHRTRRTARTVSVVRWCKHGNQRLEPGNAVPHERLDIHCLHARASCVRQR